MTRRVTLPFLPSNDVFRAAVVREIEKSIAKDVAIDHFHMRAEDGKIYKITINSAGAFVLTLVQG